MIATKLKFPNPIKSKNKAAIYAAFKDIIY